MSEHNEPVAETPATEQPVSENARNFLAMMEDIRQSYVDLKQKLTGDALYDAMVAGLSSHPNFIRMTRHLFQEMLAEYIASQSHDHATEAMEEPDHVIGYQIALLDDQSNLKAALTGSDHPVTPNSIELFYAEGDPTEKGWRASWQQIRPTEKVVVAVRSALAEVAAQPYDYRYISMTALTTQPLNEDSRVVANEENVDGSEQN